MNPECRWCGKPRTECPAPTTHEQYDRASETTWRRLHQLAAAVLTPDAEEVDRVR